MPLLALSMLFPKFGIEPNSHYAIGTANCNYLIKCTFRNFPLSIIATGRICQTTLDAVWICTTQECAIRASKLSISPDSPQQFRLPIPSRINTRSSHQATQCIGIEPIRTFGRLPVSNRTHYLSVNTANGIFIQNPITDIHLKSGWLNVPTIRIFTSFLTKTVFRCCASRYADVDF